jgi:hypothetical protein
MPSFEDLDDSVEADVDVSSLGLDSNQQQEADFEEQMSEVEMRLEKAYYYRMLLQQNPFDSDSPVAIEVWKDISKILRARLGELLGIVSLPLVSAVAPQFTEEEAKILKAVASKLLKNVEDKSKPKPKKAPSLRKVSVTEVESNKVNVRPVAKPEVKPPAVVARGRSGKSKILKKVITDNGNEVVMDVTPQTKPTGASPLPMPDIAMSNAHATAQGARIAASQDEGLIELIKAQE